MFAPRTIRRRLFLALFAVALLPAAAGLLIGTYLLREVGATSGTLGPWDEVAASGGRLVEEALRAAPGDSAVLHAAEVHSEALSASVRQSRLWTYVADRAARALPLVAAVSVILLGGIASLVAGVLSRSYSRPVAELVGWTRRIAASEPLPPPAVRSRVDVVEYAQLEDALRSMASELAEGRRRELEAARLRAWTEMARRVAHDLKNPLTPMQLAAGMLARSTDPSTQAAASVLLEEIARLDDMARSFAQLGRAPESPPSDVDMAELLQRLAERHATRDVPIVVRSEDPAALVSGHYDVLERVFRNLLVNAVEASEPTAQRAAAEVVRTVAATEGARSESTAAGVRTDAALGGPLTEPDTAGPRTDAAGGAPGRTTFPIDVRVVRSNGSVHVTIRDHGPGLPPEMSDAIWLPDVSTKRHGTGLGLAIVRQGVEAHGGRVRARNAEGGGAEFEVELPAAAERGA